MAAEISKVLNTPSPAEAANPAADRPYPFLDDASQSLCDAIETLRKSETGRELLADAEKYGTRIGLKSMSGAHGSFNDETKQVLINSASNPDRMVATLAHELRHSQQFQNGVLLNAYSDRPKDYLHSQWLIEADANVAACQVGWELKQQGNSKPLDALAEERKDIVNAFTGSAEKGGIETGEAHSKAFYVWFDDLDLRECYEKNYIRNFEYRKRNATSEDRKTALRREVPVAENIERVCKFNGKTYLKQDEAAAFYAKPELSSVTEETYWAIYRNTRDALGLDFSTPKEDVMERAGTGGFTKRLSSSWYYDLPSDLAKKQQLARRQQEAATKISKFRSLNTLDSLHTNGTKTPDLTAVVAKKRSLLQK